MKPEHNHRLLPVFAPDEIEARSFEIIDSEAPLPRAFSGFAWEVVRRMVHTSADFELIDCARFTPSPEEAIRAGVDAIKNGARIITDTQMARVGMPERRFTPFGGEVVCMLGAPEVVDLAREQGSTRTAAAVDLVARQRPELGFSGLIMAIGNAPTALIRLLKHLEDGVQPPALIVGMPVGFVNAAESKELLLEQEFAPVITIQGRKGGSALAACVVNALAEIALRERNV